MIDTRAPYFERLKPDPACAYCSGAKPPPQWDFIDGAWCISLQERGERAALAAAEFHRAGLCAKIEFYRPVRPQDGSLPRLAIWASHKAVAQRALQNGCQRVLIFEDDVRFSRPRKLHDRVSAAIKRLPEGWMGLYLGHLPLSGRLFAWGVMSVQSLLAHAYVANTGLLKWLDKHEPCDPAIPIHRWMTAREIDGAFAHLDGMYALFPMAALQRWSESDNIRASVTRSGVPRRWNDFLRYRYWIIQRLPRYAELACLALSPLHWLRARLRR